MKKAQEQLSKSMKQYIKSPDHLAMVNAHKEFQTSAKLMSEAVSKFGFTVAQLKETLNSIRINNNNQPSGYELSKVELGDATNGYAHE